MHFDKCLTKFHAFVQAMEAVKNVEITGGEDNWIIKTRFVGFFRMFWRAGGILQNLECRNGATESTCPMPCFMADFEGFVGNVDDWLVFGDFP